MNNLYGKPLPEWNRLACVNGAQQVDLELAAHLHRCGTFRMSMDGTAETYARVPFLDMNVSQRLIWTFDCFAPCCIGRPDWLAKHEAMLLGRKRSLREVMIDKSVAEATSVLVRGRAPSQLLREAKS